MPPDSGSFRQTIGKMNGRLVTMHIGARRVMGDMQTLEIISCVSLERLSPDEPTLWFGRPRNDSHFHILTCPGPHTSSIRDTGQEMIDDEIIHHIQWWMDAINDLNAAHSDEASDIIREQESLDARLRESMERIRDRFEWG